MRYFGSWGKRGQRIKKMNVEAHMSGQISGQVPNQPVMPQQNGNALPSQMQTLAAPPRTGKWNTMDPELFRARMYMREKIYDTLSQRHLQRYQQPINEPQKKKVKDIVKRLEVGVFRMASSKEEYMNLETLESRLLGLVRRPLPPNQPVMPQQNGLVTHII
ncbi:histone acetyltransferase HAC12 isoform X2 [Humulus lupulus]|uniref:histone acetyltransferase HAC12 isoform X2 n=1 Tax=Humulus lupulus TaxID=3486 RepID=UPI002B400CAE|nr:histone acetyltransferase HAC12 isoform X2 [Humulus lupulus]